MVGKTREIYNLLKSKIISMEFTPGSEITADIIDGLGISKTPFREALQYLEGEGFVVVNSRKNTIVSKITRELISNTYETRYELEPYISRAYYKNIGLEEVRFLRGEFLTYTKDADHDYFIELDDRLHTMLLDACTNPFLSQLMKNVNDHSSRLRQFISHRNEEYSHTISQHLLILDAIEMGDPDAIEAAVRYHVIWGREDSFNYIDGKWHNRDYMTVGRNIL